MMSTLSDQMHAAWKKGVETNELVIFHSKLNYVQDHNYDFIVRQIEKNNLPKKESNIKTNDKKIIDPFSKENRNSTLVVHEYSNHTLLLNKFPVLKNHCVLVTNEFESQFTPLAFKEFEVISSIVQSVPCLIFFNCGINSGASQPHKHIQLIPYTEFEEELTPFEKIMQNPSNYNISLHQCTLYDFPHTLIPVSVNQLYDPSQLLQVYNNALQEVTSKWKVNHAELDSYNMLLFKEWMLIVPRSKEAWNAININSLGFMGSFLAKSDDMLEYIQQTGPLTILKNVVNDYYFLF